MITEHIEYRTRVLLFNEANQSGDLPRCIFARSSELFYIFIDLLLVSKIETSESMPGRFKLCQKHLRAWLFQPGAEIVQYEVDILNGPRETKLIQH